MKKFKTKKISIKIAALIGIVQIAAMALLFITSNLSIFACVVITVLMILTSTAIIGWQRNAVKGLRTIFENEHLLFSEILEAQTVGTLVTNSEDNEIILINKMAVHLYGLDSAKKNSLTMDDIKNKFSKEEREKITKVRELAKNSKEEIIYETYAIHDDGRKIHFLSHAKSAHLSNGETIIIFSFIDITPLKNLESSLVHLSETDSLTSISNRRGGEQKLRNLVSDGKQGMFCLFDANKFKYINDTFGHAAGDKVLIEIANCMKKAFRTSDILIRLGGDEFVAFTPDIKEQKTGKIVLDRFIKQIEEISIPELGNHKVSVSLGAVIINGTETFEQIYTKADSVMYDCKEKGGNVYKFYE
ncbi:MAG: GGDEF domain-containing protein [Treponema sp.]|nr:GGDEF domain-containing protein [Treponema sp.]